MDQLLVELVELFGCIGDRLFYVSPEGGGVRALPANHQVQQLLLGSGGYDLEGLALPTLYHHART